MKIYIRDFDNPIRAEILPTNTPTKDETLETFSFALVSNDIAQPLAPMQKVKVDFVGDGSDVNYFYIVSDSVETFSLRPLRYKHNITCIQNTRELSKHLVRNSVFSQPGYIAKTTYNAESGSTSSISAGNPIVWSHGYIPSLNWAVEKLHLIKNEKISKARLNISFQWCEEGDSPQIYNLHTDAHSMDDILEYSPNVYDSLSFDGYFQLRYKDSGGNPQTWPTNIDAAYFGLTKLDLNASYEFPLIKQLADQGCNDFEIIFNSLDLISGQYKALPYGAWIKYWQIQIEISADVYWWSCYEVLDLLIKRQTKTTDDYWERNLFKLPQWTDGDDPKQDELYTLLKSTVAPNFTFTQLTMYECVAEVFRLFDAIFTMDEEGVLGIEFFNDLSGEPLSTKQKRFTGRTLALGEDKYTNGLVAHYQDARVVETFPKNDKFANLRSVEFGVPERSDHHFIVPHSIDSIIKCEVQLSGFNINSDAISINGDINVDITRFVVEQSVWSMLDTGAMEGNDYVDRKVKQADSVYYERGDNKIQVAYSFKNNWNITHYSLFNALAVALTRMTGMNGGVDPKSQYEGESWDLFKMRLCYIASVDGKLKVHSVVNKYEGETLVDQNNGAVDLNKMGLNMLGLSLKLGNPTLNATHRISRWADRIKVGQIYEWKDGIWIANVVNYTFFNGYVQGKVSFVQNFNALALRTQLLREKRMTNISKELVQKSEEILTDFVYYSSEDMGDQYGGLTTYFGEDYFADFIFDSFKTSGSRLKIGDFFLFDILEIDYDTHKVNAIYIPSIRYGAGNTINFELAFDHPMNAGNQTKQYASSWAGINKTVTTHIIYTDDDDGKMVIYGEEDSQKIGYGFLERVSIIAPTSTDEYTTDFPIVNVYTGDSLLELGGYINIPNLEIYKQPNEIFALNYQLAFLPIPGRENIDFIGNEFINNNCFVNDNIGDKTNRYLVFMNKKSSNLDLKATSYFLKKQISTVTLHTSISKNWLEFSITSLTALEKASGDFVSWAVVDDNDNILFASNKEIDLDDEVDGVTLYFAARHYRV